MSEDEDHLVTYSYQTAAELRAHHEKFPPIDWDEARKSLLPTDATSEMVENFERWKSSDITKRALEDACIPRLLSGECRVRLHDVEDALGRWLDPEFRATNITVNYSATSDPETIVFDEEVPEQDYRFGGIHVDVLDPECVLLLKWQR